MQACKHATYTPSDPTSSCSVHVCRNCNRSRTSGSKHILCQVSPDFGHLASMLFDSNTLSVVHFQVCLIVKTRALLLPPSNTVTNAAVIRGSGSRRCTQAGCRLCDSSFVSSIYQGIYLPDPPNTFPTDALCLTLCHGIPFPNKSPDS